MEYIAPRNMTVSSVSGRSQTFKKGEPTWAPPQMHAELIAHGIVPAEEIPEPEEATSNEPRIPAEREAALFAAFEKMVLEGKREAFTGVGIPHLGHLSKKLGWDVAAKERDAAWQKFQLIQSDKEST